LADDRQSLTGLAENTLGDVAWFQLAGFGGMRG
jgi:hypothetical protein